MCTDTYIVVGHVAVPLGMEMCRLLAASHCRTSLIIPSTISSSVPISFRENAAADVFEIPAQPGGSDPIPVDCLKQTLQQYLTTRRNNERGPVAAIVDEGLLGSMGWSIDIFSQNHIPIVGLFSSSAYSTMMEHVGPKYDKKRESLLDCIIGCGLFVSRQNASGASQPACDHSPPWKSFAKKFIGVMVNTCVELERPFVDDLGQKLRLPVWSVGPLFPREYFRLAGNVARSSNEIEANVIHWLDSKPRKTVLFVWFGTSVDLSAVEYSRLALLLEASTHSFIWAVSPESQSGDQYHPKINDGVGDRGLVITTEMVSHCKVLNHPSVAGFLSHCNWNSMLEAIGLGVPLLAWPKTGEQFHNAKLVVKKLKVGHYIPDNFSQRVSRTDSDSMRSFGRGLSKLMSDVQMRRRVTDLGARFSCQYPASSKAALDNFTEIVALL